AVSGCRLTAPVSGMTSPVRVRSRVVLPTPFGPTTTTRSPGPTVRLTRSRMTAAPRLTVTSRAVSEADTTPSLGADRIRGQPISPAQPATLGRQELVETAAAPAPAVPGGRGVPNPVRRDRPPPVTPAVTGSQIRAALAVPACRSAGTARIRNTTSSLRHGRGEHAPDHPLRSRIIGR